MGMSFHISNNLLGILNFITFLISVPILAGGIWLSHHGNGECEKFLQTPIIVLGVFLMVVSLAGFIGACCRVSCLLWLYLVVMFLLIVLMFGLTIYTFVVTYKGAGETLSNRGYKEYRLGDYSEWLQKRVNDTKYWSKMKSCLMESKVCSNFAQKYANDDAQKFYSEKLTSIESGCCKPSNDCGFDYVNPTNWTPTGTVFTNPDCNTWSNDQNVLCYDCQSCKAGFVDRTKSNWKKIAIINIIFLVFLIVVYSTGCCAFRNNRRDNAFYYPGWKP